MSIDEHIGRAIRRRRIALSLTQAQLAEKVSVRHQQIQRYECAGNRVSAARLVEIAAALDMPITDLLPNV